VGQEHHKHRTLSENRKPACPLSSVSLLTIIMHNDVWSKSLNSTYFHASSEDNVPGRVICHSGDITGLPTHLILQYQTTYFLWGYIKSKVYEMHPANICDLK
jgi:hypothetical protein